MPTALHASDCRNPRTYIVWQIRNILFAVRRGSRGAADGHVEEDLRRPVYRRRAWQHEVRLEQRAGELPACLCRSESPGHLLWQMNCSPGRQDCTSDRRSKTASAPRGSQQQQLHGSIDCRCIPGLLPSASDSKMWNLGRWVARAGYVRRRSLRDCCRSRRALLRLLFCSPCSSHDKVECEDVKPSVGPVPILFDKRGQRQSRKLNTEKARRWPFVCPKHWCTVCDGTTHRWLQCPQVAEQITQSRSRSLREQARVTQVTARLHHNQIELGHSIVAADSAHFRHLPAVSRS